MKIINDHNNRMILSYNWQILQNPVKDEEHLKQIAKGYQPKVEEPLNSQQQPSPSPSINPIILKCPKFGFLFCYRMESPKHNQPQIELIPEISLFEEQVRFKIEHKMQIKDCIYLQLQIENNQVYDSLMILAVKIRYHSQNKLPKIDSIEQLVRMAGQRKINLYTATTYATIKRQIILESPVLAEWRHEKQGYLYLKLSRGEENSDIVEIVEVEVMNWLATNQSLRPLKVRNLLKKSFKIGPKQSYGLLFTMQASIIGEQIPYYLKYRWGQSGPTFKMVKHISLFDFKE